VVPDFYGCTNFGILALENLKECGYYQRSKGSMLGLSASKLVLKALAQFHELTLEHMETIRGSLNSPTLKRAEGDDEWSSRVYKKLMEKLRKYVLPSCTGDTREIFEEYMNNYSHVLRLSYSPSEAGYNFMLHGDFHYYNLLFKNDRQNNVMQCKFIDF